MSAVILLVEDEDKLRQLVRAYLEREGLTVLSASCGAEALALRDTAADLVVLDLGLPDLPGEEVLREIRGTSTLPVLVLTAKASADDRIRGLELGADDYMTKPFSPRELVLRVQALLRRSGGAQADDAGVQTLGDGQLRIDQPRHEVRRDGEAVDLTATEWGLLVALARFPGRVYSRYELINLVRGYEFEGYERTIDSHIKNLRRKLEPDPSDPRIIQTVVGVGYRLGLRCDS